MKSKFGVGRLKAGLGIRRLLCFLGENPTALFWTAYIQKIARETLIANPPNEIHHFLESICKSIFVGVTSHDASQQFNMLAGLYYLRILSRDSIDFFNKETLGVFFIDKPYIQ